MYAARARRSLGLSNLHVHAVAASSRWLASTPSSYPGSVGFAIRTQQRWKGVHVASSLRTTMRFICLNSLHGVSPRIVMCRDYICYLPRCILGAAHRQTELNGALILPSAPCSPAYSIRTGIPDIHTPCVVAHVALLHRHDGPFKGCLASGVAPIVLPRGCINRNRNRHRNRHRNRL